ncbi:MAG: UvrD-helicase domain-containing protein [Prevotellaceae bacterium]|nr:UvrD-helicase domain-containing protein [Prevotellaceae bacterium]
MSKTIQSDTFEDLPALSGNLSGNDNLSEKDYQPTHTGLTVYGASAGSGKTYTLTLEYLKQALSAVNNDSKFREILAVTFTNKATDEMKIRIITTLHNIATGKDLFIADSICRELNISQSALKDRAAKVQQAILHNYSNFSISTIDKFFQKILHVFVREAGLHPGFRLELDQERLMNEAIDRMMLNLHKNDFLYGQMLDIIDEQMKKGSTWDIRKILKNRGNEVLKEEFREFDSQFHFKIRDTVFMNKFTAEIVKIVNVFENKLTRLADNAIDLIKGYGCQVSDFSYGKNGPVNYFYKLRAGKYEEPGKRVYNLLNSNDDNAWAAKNIPEIVKNNLLQISGDLTNILRDAVDFYEKKSCEYFTAVCIKKAMNLLGFFAEIETNIREIAANENFMPIIETTHLLQKLISESDTPFIYERAGARYSTFMIDEFQDTSEAQWQIFNPLLKNSLAEDKTSLIVGDVKQSIYRWRNGDWRILASKIFDDFSNFTITKKNLDTNWRSFPNVINFNNTVFSSLPEYIEQEFISSLNSLPTEEPESSTNSFNMLSLAYKNAEQKISGSNQNKSGYVSVSVIRDDENIKSKDKILKQLPQLIAEMQDRGYKAKNIAVLVRKATDGQIVSDCLLNYKTTSGDTTHCFDILSQDALFIKESATVQFIISLLKAVINPDDQINNATINYFQNRNNSEFKWTDSGILVEQLKTNLLEMTSLSLPEVFERLVRMFDLGNDPVEIPYIQELHDLLISFSNNEISDISAFLEYWNDKCDKIKLSEGQTPNAINITTIHKAKGLEYPVVIIPFCNWDMKPSFRDTIWASPEKEPFNQLQFIPVNPGNDMKNSYFAKDYYSETMQSLVDNLNLLYVAFTRAKEELHIMLPLPAKPKTTPRNPDNIRTASLALSNFLENNATFEKYKQQLEEDDFAYISGEKQWKQEKVEEEKVEEENFSGIFITNYNSSSFEKKLRLKYESENYYLSANPSAQEKGELRNYGTLMHRVFSLIRSAKDAPAAIARIEEEGLIGKEYIPELKTRIDKALRFADNWFADGNTYEVITEKFLLLPRSMNRGLSRRPDRIMSSENETIVVDYKFGTVKEDVYRIQVRNYVRLLEMMQYPDVKGYVWYVDMDAIEKV